MSTNDRATLVVGEVERSFDSCLQHYFQTQRLKNSKRLVGALALSESESFEKDIRNLTNQLDEFLQSDLKELAYLVLGKVQSGKTAHMVGSIAWAADSKIALAAAFTGVTEALNDQTFERFTKDLSSNAGYVSIHGVPTSHKGSQYQELKSKVFQYVQWRLESQSKQQEFNPLPVLITLKNKQRVQTLKILFDEISSTFGQDVTALLIDDEADQASQNSKANKGEIAATYSAISDLRDTKIRNLLLSYTATPQAVLLTEKFGRLRPDFCVTVKPRIGYFGLHDAVAPAYGKNRITVTDGTDSTSITAIPLSLKSSILEFFWTAWLRNKHPKIFFANTSLSEAQLDSRMVSTQMLIHESFRVANHEAMYKLVDSECQALIKILGEFLNNNLPASSKSDLKEKLLSSFVQICNRLELNFHDLSEEALSVDGIRTLLTYIIENRILIVNGDKDRSTSSFKIPVTDEDWEQRRTWILIGGDILGRGLTIPQLTTTYFLRQAKQPNFDTVSQQMRFCGYRQDYKNATTIHAPLSTFKIFEYMDQIDSIVWEKACKWDESKLNIGQELPAVMYASPVNAPIAPTRKSVQDPNLVDKRIGEFIFTLRDIMSPLQFRANLGLLKRWLVESGESAIPDNSYLSFPEVKAQSLQRLLASWSANRLESRNLRAAAELYELDGSQLGLADYPTTIFIHKSLITAPDLGVDSMQWVQTLETTRRLEKSTQTADLKQWCNIFEKSVPSAHSWPSLAVGHVGDGQRKIKRSLSYDASILLIEPILGLSETRNRGSAISAGIGMTFFAPENFEVRLVGHS